MSKEKEQKEEEIEHDYTCEECGKPATRNIQDWWHEYHIDNEGEMQEVDSWEGSHNHFLCDECDI